MGGGGHISHFSCSHDKTPSLDLFQEEKVCCGFNWRGYFSHCCQDRRTDRHNTLQSGSRVNRKSAGLLNPKMETWVHSYEHWLLSQGLTEDLALVSSTYRLDSATQEAVTHSSITQVARDMSPSSGHYAHWMHTVHINTMQMLMCA